MEISEIQKAKSIKSIQKKNAIQQPSKVEDSLSISSDAQKIDHWVEMLKEMPDIRHDKLEAALGRELPSDVQAIIAQKLLADAL